MRKVGVHFNEKEPHYVQYVTTQQGPQTQRDRERDNLFSVVFTIINPSKCLPGIPINKTRFQSPIKLEQKSVSSECMARIIL